MTKIEKQMLVTIAVVALFAMVCLFILATSIENAGGARAIIVDVGKEVKSISQEIQSSQSSSNQGEQNK